ncbi:MAG: 1-phosphofructokinase family hexose kinase [Sphingobacteriales bacterium]|nr:MAG: 1-phosphofructokinase family hexose kinase [Sphingobacteriales bacterium]
MANIITITFSPSIDKSATVNELVPTKKLKCDNANTQPGGGGINVARVLSKLGADVLAVFPSGGYTGAFFNTLLKNENVPFVFVSAQNETKENFVILDQSSKQQYRFGMPSNPLFAKEYNACLELIASYKNAAFIVASGSLPPGVPLTIYEDIAKIAKKNNAKFVVDTSGPALQNAVNQSVFLLKPNLNELGFLAGIKNLNLLDVEKVAKDFLFKKNCEIMVVSLGNEGAILITQNQTYKVKSPQVNVKTTVGAGDSMLAGIIYSLSNGHNLHQSLKYGVACGTAATLNFGSKLCEVADVEKIYKLLE